MLVMGPRVLCSLDEHSTHWASAQISLFNSGSSQARHSFFYNFYFTFSLFPVCTQCAIVQGGGQNTGYGSRSLCSPCGLQGLNSHHQPTYPLSHLSGPQMSPKLPEAGYLGPHSSLAPPQPLSAVGITIVPALCPQRSWAELVSFCPFSDSPCCQYRPGQAPLPAFFFF